MAEHADPGPGGLGPIGPPRHQGGRLRPDATQGKGDETKCSTAVSIN